MEPHIAMDAIRVLEIVEDSIRRDPTPETGQQWVVALRWIEANARYMSGFQEQSCSC